MTITNGGSHPETYETYIYSKSDVNPFTPSYGTSSSHSSNSNI